MHQIAQFKNIFLGSISTTPPPANAWLRHAPHATSGHATLPNSKNVGPLPLVNPTYSVSFS